MYDILLMNTFNVTNSHVHGQLIIVLKLWTRNKTLQRPNYLYNMNVTSTPKKTLYDLKRWKKTLHNSVIARY